MRMGESDEDGELAPMLPWADPCFLETPQAFATDPRRGKSFLSILDEAAEPISVLNPKPPQVSLSKLDPWLYPNSLTLHKLDG